jgi:transposase
MNITTIGIDLAKNVFQVHGVDERGRVVLRRSGATFDGGVGVLFRAELEKIRAR